MGGKLIPGKLLAVISVKYKLDSQELHLISGLYSKSDLLLAFLVQDWRAISCKPLVLMFPEVLVRKKDVLSLFRERNSDHITEPLHSNNKNGVLHCLCARTLY